MLRVSIGTFRTVITFTNWDGTVSVLPNDEHIVPVLSEALSNYLVGRDDLYTVDHVDIKNMEAINGLIG